MVPEHEPLRYWPLGQVILLQVLQVPGLAPTRYFLASQILFGGRTAEVEVRERGGERGKQGQSRHTTLQSQIVEHFWWLGEAQ